MKTEQIIILVVAFFLGMLLLNMVKNVCGCEVKEGFNPSELPQGAASDGEWKICNKMLNLCGDGSMKQVGANQACDTLTNINSEDDTLSIIPNCNKSYKELKVERQRQVDDDEEDDACTYDFDTFKARSISYYSCPPADEGDPITCTYDQTRAAVQALVGANSTETSDFLTNLRANVPQGNYTQDNLDDAGNGFSCAQNYTWSGSNADGYVLTCGDNGLVSAAPTGNCVPNSCDAFDCLGIEVRAGVTCGGEGGPECTSENCCISAADNCANEWTDQITNLHLVSTEVPNLGDDFLEIPCDMANGYFLEGEQNNELRCSPVGLVEQGAAGNCVPRNVCTSYTDIECNAASDGVRPFANAGGTCSGVACSIEECCKADEGGEVSDPCDAITCRGACTVSGAGSEATASCGPPCDPGYGGEQCQLRECSGPGDGDGYTNTPQFLYFPQDDDEIQTPLMPLDEQFGDLVCQFGPEEAANGTITARCPVAGWTTESAYTLSGCLSQAAAGQPTIAPPRPADSPTSTCGIWLSEGGACGAGQPAGDASSRQCGPFPFAPGTCDASYCCTACSPFQYYNTDNSQCESAFVPLDQSSDLFLRMSTALQDGCPTDGTESQIPGCPGAPPIYLQNRPWGSLNENDDSRILARVLPTNDLCNNPKSLSQLEGRRYGGRSGLDKITAMANELRSVGLRGAAVNNRIYCVKSDVVPDSEQISDVSMCPSR